MAAIINQDNPFFKWAYGSRAKTIEAMLQGEKVSPEKTFLSFTSHTPAFVSNGPQGLNASIKGIGWTPKKEYVPAVLEEYVAHIQTYKRGDETYSQRGLAILYKNLYSEEAAKTIDFSAVASIEMGFVHSWHNYLENPGATLLFYQPPAISFELRGTIEILGKRHAKEDAVERRDLDLYQQFVNAQHDMYHAPDMERWKTRPVYFFHIEEIYNNSVGPDGFGKKTDLFLE